jgi:hypothetical protein
MTPALSSELPNCLLSLLTAKLLQDIVEVAAEDSDDGVVGAQGGLADLQGPLVLGSGLG